MAEEMIEELKERFAFLKDDVLAILVFGSHASGEGAPSSDVDICIVAPESRPSEVLSKVYQNMDTKRLDVYCFSELPLHLKMDVIHHHKTLFVRDRPALYEHFYLYRKLWADEERRHRVTKEEILAML